MFQNTKNKSTEQAKSAAHNFKRRREVNESGEAIYEDARDVGERAVHNLRSIAHDAGERVQGFFNEKKGQAQDARVSAERTIRDNPLAAVAGAFAVGALLARLLRRR